MDPTSVLATQGLSILAIPRIVQWMKHSNLPFLKWIHDDTKKIAAVVAWALGILASVGIHIHASWAANGTASFTVEGLTIHTLLVVAGQLLGQQHVYELLQYGKRLGFAAEYLAAVQEAQKTR